MDGELVTDLSSDDFTGDGGVKGRQSLVLRYGKKFEELCGYYMSIGMSYRDYWDGDSTMVKYYRQADELRKERRNAALWLQGIYFYEALLNASPVLNPLSSRKKPFPFRDSPIPLTEAEKTRLDEIDKQKRLEAGREAMRAMMIAFNEKFEERRLSDDGN